MAEGRKPVEALAEAVREIEEIEEAEKPEKDEKAEKLPAVGLEAHLPRWIIRLAEACEKFERGG